jgi:hypothetical protein
MPKVPQRMAWRVMMPNQVSIWFSQLEPFGVKWKWTFGCVFQPGTNPRVPGVGAVECIASCRRSTSASVGRSDRWDGSAFAEGFLDGGGEQFRGCGRWKLVTWPS